MSSGAFGPESQLGHVIGDYQLEAVVGKGGASVVFRGRRVDGSMAPVEQTAAYAIELPSVAAVKLLIIPWQASAEEREENITRFKHEIRILGALKHPHILPIIADGVDEQTGSLYMILPYLPVGSLAQKIKQQPLEFDEAARILQQVASAMDYANSQGVRHRDIKPDNILLDDAGQAYLADFSIAKMQEEFTARVTQSGMFVGTLAYVAPEVRLRPKESSLAADIYSLGVTAYEMLAGMQRDTEADPAALRMLRPDLPMPAAEVIRKALSPAPADRFASAMEFAQAFSLGLQGVWAAGVEPPPVVVGGAPLTRTGVNNPTVPDARPAGLTNRSARARRLVAVLGGAVALLLIAGVVGVSFRGHGVFFAAAQPGGGNSGAGAKANVAPTATLKKRTATPTATSTANHSGGSSQTGGGGGPVNNGSSGGGGGGATATNTPAPAPTATFTPTPRPTATFTPTPTQAPTPTNTPVVRSIQIGWSTAYPTWIWMTVNNFSSGTYKYYCTFSTPPAQYGYNITISSSPEHFDNKNTCYDSQVGDHVWVVINGVSSNTLTVP